MPLRECTYGQVPTQSSRTLFTVTLWLFRTATSYKYRVDLIMMWVCG